MRNLIWVGGISKEDLPLSGKSWSIPIFSNLLRSFFLCSEPVFMTVSLFYYFIARIIKMTFGGEMLEI